jgi:hypothetical protein
MLADALGQDTVDYLDRIGVEGDHDENVIESIDIETGEILGVG